MLESSMKYHSCTKLGWGKTIICKDFWNCKKDFSVCIIWDYYKDQWWVVGVCSCHRCWWGLDEKLHTNIIVPRQRQHRDSDTALLEEHLQCVDTGNEEWIMLSGGGGTHQMESVVDTWEKYFSRRAVTDVVECCHDTRGEEDESNSQDDGQYPECCSWHCIMMMRAVERLITGHCWCCWSWLHSQHWCPSPLLTFPAPASTLTHPAHSSS